MIKIIDKDICLIDGTKIKINIKIPVRGECVIDEKAEDFVKETTINQVLRGLRDSIDAYKESELPNKFLRPQIFVVTNELPYNILGVFSCVGDDIYVEADAISNIRKVSASFLLGHEMGHKIAKYTNPTSAYKSIASSFGMSVEGNEHFLNETYADLCGSIVSGEDDIILPDGYTIDETLGENHTEYLKKQVLRNIYHF